MPRSGRIVYPHVPHHVTQRGNRRAPIFFEPGDQEFYLGLLAEQTRKHAAEVWAFCLMPNHVHLILTPGDERGLGRAMGEVHRLYALRINARHGWSGHLFQDRFASVPMGEDHLVAAFRYVATNPVRAGLAERAQDWRWSSVHAHLAGRDTRLVRVAPLLARVGDIAELLETSEDADARYSEAFAALRQAELTNRPLGVTGRAGAQPVTEDRR
ncbi:transposase [Phenylobacterium terrae]|uniref:Transposase n=1 Tax=Phenylobacterium terrae TaxID=2665495 RepID=A0ABW4N105_9CAUL